jgi:putative transposase
LNFASRLFILSDLQGFEAQSAKQAQDAFEQRKKPEPLAVSEAISEGWSIDFLHDQLFDGRSSRLLNVVDDDNRVTLCMETDFSLPSERVIRALKLIIECRGRPVIIRCDNGPGNTSGVIQNWIEMAGIAFQYIQPGKPRQNAYVERFNRTVRYEWFSQHYWQDLDEVRDHATG